MVKVLIAAVALLGALSCAVLAVRNSAAETPTPTLASPLAAEVPPAAPVPGEDTRLRLLQEAHQEVVRSYEQQLRECYARPGPVKERIKYVGVGRTVPWRHCMAGCRNYARTCAPDGDTEDGSLCQSLRTGRIGCEALCEG